MSAEHDQEYFSDGVAQEIINALAQVPGLHVVARSSSFSFKGKSVDLRSVGDTLDVAHVLEGSVRKSGQRLRISAQLVSTADGYQLWSQTFDRDQADVFAVQDEIARAVVIALKIRVLPSGEGPGRKATSPEAYTHYLRGLQLQDSGSIAQTPDAIDEYRRTIALDASYAPAHARLAEALLRYGNSGEATNEEASSWTRNAVAEAERAVELDPSRVDGYVARGSLRTAYTWDWSGARADLERAVTLSPGDANAQRRYGHLLAVLGRLPEAIPVRPDGARARPTLGGDPLPAGQPAQCRRELCAQAQELLRKALEIAPQHALADRELAFTELLDGQPAAALAQFQALRLEWLRNFGARSPTTASDGARSHRPRSTASSPPAATPPSTRSPQIHAWRGERDLAFVWLERARIGRDAGLRYLKYDPLLRSLRGDPRWAALLQKLGLPLG